MQPLPTIAVLGASGLIGEAIASRLQSDGFPLVPVARQFNPAQRKKFGNKIVEAPVVALSADGLADLLSVSGPDIVVNCIGILQDGSRGNTDDIHHGFVARLMDALGRIDHETLFIHLSIPGTAADDQTSFSRTKRQAEQIIEAGTAPSVVIRPGFVIAPAAYGGSALVRALAVLPVELPSREQSTPFAITSVTDILRSIDIVARRWQGGDHNWHASWDVMSRDPTTLGEVIAAFRQRLGGNERRLAIPAWMMDLGAKAGDLAARLGWSPPIRGTALHEVRRGVIGDATSWVEATGIHPTPLASAIEAMPASIQEKWFARLYLLKPVVIASLAVFWFISGAIALTVAFDAATMILTTHGFSLRLAQAITILSSLTDIGIGLAVAYRKTCRTGLLAGIAVALFYMASAAVITPEMWIEPLGALVKTIPAIVLMLVALAILDDR